LIGHGPWPIHLSTTVKQENFTGKLLYKNKYWQGTKFDKLANRQAIAKFKFHQYFSIAYQL